MSLGNFSKCLCYLGSRGSTNLALNEWIYILRNTFYSYNFLLFFFFFVDLLCFEGMPGTRCADLTQGNGGGALGVVTRTKAPKVTFSMKQTRWIIPKLRHWGQSFSSSGDGGIFGPYSNLECSCFQPVCHLPDPFKDWQRSAKACKIYLIDLAKKHTWHSMYSSCMYTKCPWRIWMPIRLKNFSLPQTCTKGAFWKAVQYNHIYVPHLGNCPKMIVSVNSSNISQCSSKNQISPSSATQINATAKGTLSPLSGWILRKQG